MSNDFKPFPNLRNLQKTLALAPSTWGGGLLLCLKLLLWTAISPTDAHAQCSPPFEFVVERVEPTDMASNTPSPADPGPFNGYYRVKLRSLVGNLPQTYDFNYLAFGATVTGSDFSVLIDEALSSNAMSNTGYQQFLTLDDATGEIDWQVGTALSSGCSGEGASNTLQFPANTTEVVLFTVAVTGAPGETATLTKASGTFQDCPSDCEGSVQISGNPATGWETITFPAFGGCMPEITVSYAYETAPLSWVTVSLNNLVPGEIHKKINLSIHFVPSMNGIANMDFIMYGISGGPAWAIMRKVKNADGSFDFFLSSATPWQVPSGSSSVRVAGMELRGQYNLSQGGEVLCSLVGGQIIKNVPGVPPQVVCALTGTNQTVVIPGTNTCPNNITMVNSVWTDPQTCKQGIAFHFTTENGLPVSVNKAVFELRFVTSANNIADAPTYEGIPACPTCEMVPTLTGGGHYYLFEYVWEPGVRWDIENGAEMVFPFDIVDGCVEYFVFKAEVTLADGTLCAIDFQPNLSQGVWPLCAERVGVSVLYETLVPSQPEIPFVLKSINTPTYSMSSLIIDCEFDHTLCPDPSKAPFAATVPLRTDNPLCGVSTFDLYLISRHILGVELLNSPYKMIAADGAGNGNVTSFDILELRKQILGISNIPVSWRYFGDNYAFSNPANPFANGTLYTAGISDTEPVSSQSNIANFIAVKIGDVNYTCGCIAGNKPSDKVADRFKLQFQSAQKRGSIGSQFVPVILRSNVGVEALQAGFKFDPALFRVKNILPNQGAGIGQECLGTTKLGEGEIRFAWAQLDGETVLNPGTLLFTLEVEPVGRRRNFDGSAFQISDETLESVAYEADGTEHPLVADWEAASSRSAQAASMFVSPNPLRDGLRVVLQSEQADRMNARLLDTNGRSVQLGSFSVRPGENVLELPAQDLAPGVYSLLVQSEHTLLTERVVKL